MLHIQNQHILFKLYFQKCHKYVFFRQFLEHETEQKSTDEGNEF